MTNYFLEIPENFWSLFRSKNRQIYIDALLCINEEYQYSNYFLSREICISALFEHFSRSAVLLEKDEDEEDELEQTEPVATRILSWLLKHGWLRSVQDYNSMITYIVIPDYAGMFVDAFVHLAGEDEDETQIYIQNVYGILFAFRNDPRSNISLLKTALVNTRKLNKSLQDMLHNTDKFFESLLETDNYSDLLKEHLGGYVEEVVRRKYHILKTSDNFYLYKADIKKLIQEMRQDEDWLLGVCTKNRKLRGVEITVGEIYEQLDLIERGFADIEHRIMNMDREHIRYIRATVTRLNYLLSTEDNMKGLVIQLLNRISETEIEEEQEKRIGKVAEVMNLSYPAVFSKKSFYKRRRAKQSFVDALKPEEAAGEELSRDEVLKLNRMKNRYDRGEIDEFVSSHMKDGVFAVDEASISSAEDFERLVLAYDQSVRKDSFYRAEVQEGCIIDNGKYRYPKIVFQKKEAHV